VVDDLGLQAHQFFDIAADLFHNMIGFVLAKGSPAALVPGQKLSESVPLQEFLHHQGAVVKIFHTVNVWPMAVIQKLELCVQLLNILFPVDF